MSEYIKIEDFIDFVETKHKKDVSILITWDKESNSCEVLTQGSDAFLADRAALYGNNIMAMLGLSKNEDTLVQDIRHRHKKC